MDKLKMTAQDLTRFGTYSRLAYVSKQPGYVHADMPSEGRNKNYSLGMAMKWAFLATFDGRFTLPIANEVADIAMRCIPWMIAASHPEDDNAGQRLWLVATPTLLFSGRSGFTPQPEEEETHFRFSLFEATFWPEIGVEIWCRKNPATTQERGGSGTGLNYYKAVRKPAFKATRTTVTDFVSILCLSDIFERIAETYSVDPYAIGPEQFELSDKASLKVHEFDPERLLMSIT